MPYLIKFEYFLNQEEGLGCILQNNEEIGSFSFKRQENGLYINFLELRPQYRGNKILSHLIGEIKKSMNFDLLFFHAQDLNNPNLSNEKLVQYYKSLGFKHIHSNYFQA